MTAQELDELYERLDAEPICPASPGFAHVAQAAFEATEPIIRHLRREKYNNTNAPIRKRTINGAAITDGSPVSSGRRARKRGDCN